MNKVIIANNAEIFFHNGYSLYKKNISTIKNQASNKIYCIGTPLYKGENTDSIFEKILNDFFSKELKYNDINGNFLIIFENNNTKEINILSDKTEQHHLFYDKKTKVISTSFLDLVKSNQGKLELDRYGLYEKISIGFHLGENTIFKNIIRINPENIYKLDNFHIKYLNDHKLPKLNELKFHKKGITKSLEQQAKTLNQYFSLINATFENKIGDLGLSGGFDCRLILSLAEKNINSLLHLHTHSTQGVHDKQSKIAHILAKSYGSDLTKIITNSPTKLDKIKFNKMLNDNIDFFDARTARHIGAYSQTYTENYKRESMGNAYYSLNGLGGEIYRDSYFTGSKKMNWEEWADRYLFLEGTKEIVPQDELNKISNNVKEILERKLHWKNNYYDILFTHAYYGLIKMPLCNGSVVSAYNKVSPFLLPFIEYNNVIEALKAIHYFHIGGKYQAKLMTLISPKLAEIPSHYGGTFKALGFKYYTWSLIKTLSTTKYRNTILLKKLVKKSKSLSAQTELNNLNKSEDFKESMMTLKNIDPRLNLNVALVESTNKRNIILLGFFLKKYL